LFCCQLFVVAIINELDVSAAIFFNFEHESSVICAFIQTKDDFLIAVDEIIKNNKLKMLNYSIKTSSHWVIGDWLFVLAVFCDGLIDLIIIVVDLFFVLFQ
jgi:hypothetical protein